MYEMHTRKKISSWRKTPKEIKLDEIVLTTQVLVRTLFMFICLCNNLLISQDDNVRKYLTNGEMVRQNI